MMGLALLFGAGLGTLTTSLAFWLMFVRKGAGYEMVGVWWTENSERWEWLREQIRFERGMGAGLPKETTT